MLPSTVVLYTANPLLVPCSHCTCPQAACKVEQMLASTRPLSLMLTEYAKLT